MTANGSLPLLMPHASADGQTEVDLDAVLYHVSIVLYTLTVVLGITGNSVVVWVAGFKLKPTVTNIWLVNLAVADLIFCLTRVVSLTKKVLYDHWPFGVFICKFNSFFKYANMFCSVFLLAAISADRVLCVWHPVFAKRRRTPRAARLVGAGVWAAALAMSAPYFAYRQVFLDKNNASKCSLGDMERSEVRKRALFSIRFLCGFLLPFLVILCCYVAAALGIRRTRLSGKSRPLRILASLVLAFFLCWAPYHCLLLVKMGNDKDRAVKAWLPLASALAYFNSCVNPLLYFCTGLDARGAGGSRVRRTLAGAFRRALAEDGGGGDGRSTASVDGTLEESTGSAGARTKRGEGDRVLVHLQEGGASV